MSNISVGGRVTDVLMTISTGGAVSVTGMTLCSASGSVVPRSSGKNIFNISLTFTGSNCALGNGGTASGIFYFDSVSETAIALALTPSKADGFIAVGGKKGNSSSTEGSMAPATPASPVKLPAQSAEGLWSGKANPGGAVRTLVQANGAYYQFYGDAAPVGNINGTSSLDSSNNLSFDTSKGYFSGGGYVQGQTVTTSTVITNDTLNFTISGGLGVTRVITQMYDKSYSTPFTKADLVGNYSGASVGQASTFSIDGNGNISGNAARRTVTGSCPITGTIAPNNSKRFAIVSIAGCSDSVNGVGVALLVGNGVGQQIYIGTQDGYGYTLYGVKQ